MTKLSYEFTIFIAVITLLLISYMIIYRNKTGFIAKIYSINEFKNNNKIEKIFIITNIFELWITAIIVYLFSNNYHFNLIFSTSVFINCILNSIGRKLLKKYDDKK
ncbi:MAG: hypothetical protein RR048_01910 [Oscillospiraceae bacterium]